MASKIDEQIRNAMGGGNGSSGFDPFAPSEEEGMFRQAMDLFRGQQKFWNLLVVVSTFGFMAVIVIAAIQFFGAESTRMQIMWATISVCGGLCVATLKLWAWMQMNKNSLAREIKRLELQIAALKSVMEEGDD